MTARPRSTEPDAHNTDATLENGEPVQRSSDPSLKINQKKSAHPFLPLLGPFRTGLMQYLLCFDQLEKPSIALRELICVPGIGDTTGIMPAFGEVLKKNVNLAADYLKLQLQQS